MLTFTRYSCGVPACVQINEVLQFMYAGTNSSLHLLNVKQQREVIFLFHIYRKFLRTLSCQFSHTLPYRKFVTSILMAVSEKEGEE